ncbi:hypothetical protein [Roseomonas marmotae]|uniref:PAS domain-containing protein n=1 Tax=Roseomonas marmotae TaxID=2768161 RepID=A0ABS3K6J2_9PROT|nr:hypothetical protein [Roseomonas marmotae]MBO1073065.1 hypothetical protein [Roseomonas marmotae]QTI79291.1 hypothetical protein IAI58_00150 [Roseomonas marmotae]
MDKLPAAIYVTNAEGVVIYYNSACVAFAGRTPRIGQDIWSITWRLFTENGEPLPLDQCPMAVAIRERRAVRGVRAVAARPDGSYVRFQPHPTPLFDEGGNLLGAVNLLQLDATGPKQAHSLRAKAAKYRQFVNLMPAHRSALLSMAEEYDEKALRIERQN